MGKVVKAIAVIAIAAAIAVAAPYIAGTVLALHGVVGTIAAAAIGGILSIGASKLAQALSPTPHTSTAPGRQPSRGQPYERDGLRWSYPPDPACRRSLPISDRWWRDPVFCPWQNVAIRPVVGSCMVPVLPAGRKWVVVERNGELRTGDLCLFRPDDIVDYLRRGGFDPRGSAGLIKRFIGVDRERRVMVYETTNPPNRMETGLDRVQHLYRVRSWHDRWWQAVRAYWSRDPGRVD